jgi:hypothetical protein
MAFEFDFSQVPEDPTKIQDGNGDRVTPGKGMAVINGWNEFGGAKGLAHELELEIVAWSNQEDIAKTHKENIFHKDSTGKGFPMKRMTCLAMAAGLFTANDVKAWKAAGKAPEIDMQKLVGRPIMIELIAEPDKNDATKTYIRIGNIGLAFYHIKDPRIAAWPKNQNIYNANAHAVGDWITETKPASAKTETKKAATAVAAATTGESADPFGGVL